MEDQLQAPVQKRKIPALNVVLFAVSIVLYVFTYIMLFDLLRISRAEFLILVYFGLEMAVFVLSVIATIHTARNLSKMKGLGFCVTSLALSFIQGVFGPIFFVLYLMSFYF